MLGTPVIRLGQPEEHHKLSFKLCSLQERDRLAVRPAVVIHVNNLNDPVVLLVGGRQPERQ